MLTSCFVRKRRANAEGSGLFSSSREKKKCTGDSVLSIRSRNYVALILSDEEIVLKSSFSLLACVAGEPGNKGWSSLLCGGRRVEIEG